LEEEFHAAKSVRNLLGKKVLMEVDGYFRNFPFHFPTIPLLLLNSKNLTTPP